MKANKFIATTLGIGFFSANALAMVGYYEKTCNTRQVSEIRIEGQKSVPVEYRSTTNSKTQKSSSDGVHTAQITTGDTETLTVSGMNRTAKESKFTFEKNVFQTLSQLEPNK